MRPMERMNAKQCLARTGCDGTRMALAALTLVAALIAPPDVSAEPYMALREGSSCADCHTNRTGGGMRSFLVEMHSADVLHIKDGEGIFPEPDERFSPQIASWLRIGADFRVTDRLEFQDDPDAQGRVDNNTAFREIESNDIDVEQATVYGSLTLIQDYLTFYVDERFAPGGADNREAFGIIDQMLPGETYIKAGRFFPAWGLKLQDDEAFVGAASGFNFDRTVTGLEVGRGGMGLNWFLTVAEGTEDDDTDQLLMGSAFYLTENGFMMGASAAHDEPDENEIDAFSWFGGLSVGRLVGLAQGVYMDTDVSGVNTQSWAAYGELDYLIGGWMNAKLAFDYLDPDVDVSDDARNRFSIGVEPFLDEYLQIRMFYRVLNGPQDQPAANRDELTLEGHIFF